MQSILSRIHGAPSLATPDVAKLPNVLKHTRFRDAHFSFTKAPSVIRKLTEPAAYRAELKKFKQERKEKHFERLMTELREENPRAEVVKHEVSKLRTCGKGVNFSYAAPVPKSANERTQAKAEYERMQKGIQKAMHKAPGCSTFLLALGMNFMSRCDRIDAVMRYEDHAQAALDALKPPDPLDDQSVWKMSDGGGATGAVFYGGKKERQERLFFGRARAPEMDIHAYEAVSKPKVEYQGAIKVERDVAAAKKAVRLYQVLDHVARRACLRLPFRFGQHKLLEANNESVKAGLDKTAASNADRAEKVADMKAAVEESPILVQEFVPGKVATEVSLEAKKKLLTDPKQGADVGKTLVVGPLTGLAGDHMGPDGCGYVNWENFMVDDQGRLAAIDLGVQPDGLRLDSMEGLVVALKKLARAAAKGSGNVMPENYREILKGALDDFIGATFKPGPGALFELDDWVPPTPEERALKQQIPELEQSLRKAENLLTDDDIEYRREKIRAKKAEQTKLFKARDALARPQILALRDEAMPNIIKGIVQGMEWVMENVEALAEAHEAGDSLGANLDRKGMEELAKFFQEGLSPTERAKLKALKPRSSELAMQLA